MPTEENQDQAHIETPDPKENDENREFHLELLAEMRIW